MGESYVERRKKQIFAICDAVQNMEGNAEFDSRHAAAALDGLLSTLGPPVANVVRFGLTGIDITVSEELENKLPHCAHDEKTIFAGIPYANEWFCNEECFEAESEVRGLAAYERKLNS